MAREGLERLGSHELARVRRHGDAYLAALLLKPAQHLASLVRGDAARHEERDAGGVAVNERLCHDAYASSVATTRMRLQ